jgi:murein DD-endopeptidase MepM/ murein hydrolase activator NlpD
LGVVFLVTVFSGSTLAAEDRNDRDRLNQLTDQQAQLRRQILDKQKQAVAAKKQVQQLANDVSRLERDIQTTERKISDTESAISDTQADIQTKADEIHAAEATLETQKGYQSEAIRVLYETGEDDPVKLMLASTRLSDLVDASEYLTSLEERIALIIDQVTETKQGLEDRRRALEQKEAELARLKAQQEAYKVGLATQQQQKVILKADAKAKQASLEQQIQEAKELVNSVESEMARLRSALTRKGGPGTIQARDRGTSTVGFQWPTDYTYVSTYFGGSTPFQPNGGHGGLDLVNVSGTPIYAAADGTVTAVAEMVTNGHYYAYGRYVVIGHNARFSSLYAHFQSVAVSPGDEVKRGDVIGYMGATGWATGPHLHFEIWESDRRADPLLYLP